MPNPTPSPPPNCPIAACPAELVKAHEATMANHNRQLNAIVESVRAADAKMTAILGRQDGLDQRLQGVVSSLLAVKEEVHDRVAAIGDTVEAERDDRRRADDSLRDSVKMVVDNLNQWCREVREYRSHREAIDVERDRALGIRIASIPERDDAMHARPTGVLSGIAKAMSEPWWWAMIIAVGGAVTVQQIVARLFGE